MSAPISTPALADRGPTATVHIGREPIFDAKRTVVADDRVVRCATTTPTTTTGSCTCMHSTPRNGGTGWLCR